MRNLEVFRSVLADPYSIEAITEVGRLMWLGEKEDYLHLPKQVITFHTGINTYKVLLFRKIYNVGRVAHLVRQDPGANGVDFVIAEHKVGDAAWRYEVRSIGHSPALRFVNELKLKFPDHISGGGHPAASGMLCKKLNLFNS